MSVSTIEEGLVDIKSGRMVILVDDEDRENEGDLCIAAQFVTPEAINFMARYGRGLICLTLTEEHADKLRLTQMVRDNRSRFGTAFTVSIEAKQGVTTGISAADRATTVLAAVADGARPDDLVSPGHIFPIRAKKGGVVPWGPSHQWADGSLRLHTFATVLGLVLVSLAKLALGTSASAQQTMKSLAEIRATLVRTTTGATGRRPTVMLAPELTTEQRRAVRVFELDRWFPSILSCMTTRAIQP